MKKITCLIAAFLIAGSVGAAVVSWDGGGANTDWNTALNWSTDALPTSADDPEITVNATVTISSDVTTDYAANITIRDANAVINHTAGILGEHRQVITSIFPQGLIISMAEL